MRRQPGSGINRRNGEVILKFLRYYTAELQRGEGGDEFGDGLNEVEAPTTVEPLKAPKVPLRPDAPAPDASAAPPAEGTPAPQDAGSPASPASPNVMPDPNRRDL
jgi:hypothetical protein